MLDEAHNIEDSTGDAAGGSFDLYLVTITMQECEKMVDSQILLSVHEGENREFNMEIIIENLIPASF